MRRPFASPMTTNVSSLTIPKEYLATNIDYFRIYLRRFVAADRSAI